MLQLPDGTLMPETWFVCCFFFAVVCGFLDVGYVFCFFRNLVYFSDVVCCVFVVCCFCLLFLLLFSLLFFVGGLFQ